MKLITAMESDAREICDLLNMAYRSGKGWTTESNLVEGNRTSVEQVRSTFADSNTFFLIHKAQEEILSCVCLERIDERVFIGSLAVNLDHQCLGLGSATLAAAEVYAATKWPINQLSMVVVSGRTELMSFYARRGYRRTGKFAPYPTYLNVGRPILQGLTTEELVKSV